MEACTADPGATRGRKSHDVRTVGSKIAFDRKVATLVEIAGAVFEVPCLQVLDKASLSPTT